MHYRLAFAAMLIVAVIGGFMLLPHSSAQGDNHESRGDVFDDSNPSGLTINDRRYTIINAVTEYDNGKDAKDFRRATNAVLIDSDTGDTWILWPKDSDPRNGYTWKKMPR